MQRCHANEGSGACQSTQSESNSWHSSTAGTRTALPQLRCRPQTKHSRYSIHHTTLERALRVGVARISPTGVIDRQIRMVGVSALTDMPDEILRNILAKITLRERLSSCSLVCRRFHRAAAASTQQLQLSRCNQEQFASFQRYLVSNGQHLRSLKVDRFNEHLWQLPCSNLKELEIEFCTVQLDPIQLASYSYSYPGILQSCSGLTRLKLDFCKLLLSFDSSTLAAVPELRHLQLTWLSSAGAAKDPDIMLPDRLLVHLTKLTYLRLDTIHGEELQGCAQHLSSLADLALLNLKATYTKVVWSPSTTPGLSSLTALTHMRIHNCDMDPDILAGFTELRWLQLEQINMCR